VDEFGRVTSGEVTCLATVGNQAVLGGPMEEFPGQSHFILAEDNGNESGGHPDVEPQELDLHNREHLAAGEAGR
jgi:hypothetical protein